RIMEIRSKLEELLVRTHVEAQKAWKMGASEEQMKDILTHIRHAQWRWDYVAASHGGSFHSPVETARIIGKGIDVAQEARVKLARLLAILGFTDEVDYPDISSKAQAQEFIGLKIEELILEKNKFLKQLLPKWKATAEKREQQYPVRNL
ncbi:MAG: ammonia-forming cytochrome c nitrite reductase subunit c552, partial [Bacteroidales bacterium]|nr:ammonia-forming cytochrome c nitrite reductase subunit c552 [Bacteroidales bacterium]